MNVTGDELRQLIQNEPSADMTKDQRDRLAVRIVTEIDKWAVNEYTDPYRWHLGASIIGRECDRFLYLTFHWGYASSHAGQRLRLFQRGHDEENRFVKYLQGIGFTYQGLDPTTGKQFAVSYHHGHFGGRSDGVLKFPLHWGIPGFYQPEFKTSQHGAEFNNLAKKGLETWKEEHHTQQSVYGYSWKMKYGIYLAVNKNDDELFCEVMEVSTVKAEAAVRRAGNIIASDYVPAMMPGARENNHKCKMCCFHPVCHMGKPLAINCRSCQHSEPTFDAEWKCNRHGQTIPRHFVAIGCEDHKALL